MLPRLISWCMTTRCLAVTGGGSLSQPSWLLVRTIIQSHLLTGTHRTPVLGGGAIWLSIIVLQNTTENNLPSYSPNNHHSSDGSFHQRSLRSSLLSILFYVWSTSRCDRLICVASPQSCYRRHLLLPSLVHRGHLHCSAQLLFLNRNQRRQHSY